MRSLFRTGNHRQPTASAAECEGAPSSALGDLLRAGQTEPTSAELPQVFNLEIQSPRVETRELAIPVDAFRPPPTIEMPPILLAGSGGGRGGAVQKGADGSLRVAPPRACVAPKVATPRMAGRAPNDVERVAAAWTETCDEGLVPRIPPVDPTFESRHGHVGP